MMATTNPKIDTQIYEECVHCWRNLHLGLFYSQIPILIDSATINKLIENFKFPKLNDFYELDKFNITSQIGVSKIITNGFNTFSFFILWNSLGSMIRAFREGVCKEKDFEDYIKKKLNTQFGDYKKLVFFLRNFFSHNIDKQFRIHSEDIASPKSRNTLINLKIDSKSLNLSGPEIDLDINLDFSKINGGDKLTDLISLEKIFLFADFCGRLALDYQQEIINQMLAKK